MANTLSSSAQQLADALADYFTAAELRTLVTSWQLDDTAVWHETRQATAEAIVRLVVAHGREADLRAYIQQQHPDALPDDDTLILPTETWNAFRKERPRAATGVLSGDSVAEATHTQAERYVNLGFASRSNPSQPLELTWPLETERLYFFWVEIGALLTGSIVTEATTIDLSNLPDNAVLHVALFPFPGELSLTTGQDVGQLALVPDGSLRVAKQPVRPPRTAGDLLNRRLFFPIRTPEQAGEYRLRCHIYYEQVLLQSHLVTAVVSPSPKPQKEPPALRATADFIFSQSLSPAHLATMPRHRLSLMMNDNDEGTHSFRFFGQGEFKNDVTLEAGELQNLLKLARGALRKAAWGDEEPYTPNKTYRYNGQVDLKQTFVDLLRCAIRGYRFYDALIDRLAGDSGTDWEALADQMRTPGDIQLASKVSARLLVPAALFYDHQLDTGLKASEYSLCETYATAVQDHTPLLETVCFQGNCPHYDEDDVICPSGFWGFRHALGMPASIQGAPDAPLVLDTPNGLDLAVAVCTDKNFRGREAHEETLRQLAPGLNWLYADERPETLSLMKRNEPHVLYFFCHGRVAADTPSIIVGPPETRGIARDNLRNSRIRWRTTRPLVFINGCHTTALAPEFALDLVSGFVGTSHAAGVIGTEITTFVPLAREFAESCLRYFLTEKRPIGDAVRRARLDLLQHGNPLGLIYIPYVLTGLRLE
jgi:hypothetical protein